MDTENFIVSRAEVLERLQTRRSRDLEAFPFHFLDNYGVHLPIWLRMGLSFVTKGGALSKVLEIGLPLVAPFLYQKQIPFVQRLVQRLFSPKS